MAEKGGKEKNSTKVSTLITETNVNANVGIEKEKKELFQLNSKLANVVEKVDSLVSENKQLKDLLKQSEAKSSHEEIEHRCKKHLEKLEEKHQDKYKEIPRLELENESLRLEVENLNERLQEMQKQNHHLKNEVEKYEDHRRESESESKLGDWKKRYDNVNEKLKSKNIQNAELTNKIELLQSELDINKDLHEDLVKKLKAKISNLQKVHTPAGSNQQNYQNMIKKLRAEYENNLKQTITLLEKEHQEEIERLKTRDDLDGGEKINQHIIEEYLSQIKDLENQLQKLEIQKEEAIRGRIDDDKINKKTIYSLRLELKRITEITSSLQSEISTYRSLLEYEEDKLSMKSVITAIGGFQTDSEAKLAEALARSDPERRTPFTVPTNGPVKILELETKGKYIALENVAKSAPNMKNWILTQTFEKGKSYTHKFTDGNVFSSGNRVKIWGSNHSDKKDGITSSTVTEWRAKAIPSKITLKDENGKEIDEFEIK